MEVAKDIITGLGSKEWVSMELSSRTMSDPGADVPAEHARRDGKAWKFVKNQVNGW